MRLSFTTSRSRRVRRHSRRRVRRHARCVTKRHGPNGPPSLLAPRRGDGAQRPRLDCQRRRAHAGSRGRVRARLGSRSEQLRRTLRIRQRAPAPAIALARSRYIGARSRSTRGRSDAANGLGVLLVDARRAADAVPYFERALQSAPDFVEARLNLGIALQEAGRRKRAAEEYRRARGARRVSRKVTPPQSCSRGLGVSR